MDSKPRNATPSVSLSDIEVDADTLDLQRAASIYREHGCLVVRRLMVAYLDDVLHDINHCIEETLGLMDSATPCPEGWSTQNGALLIPAPEGYERDKQIMVLPIGYRNSAALFRSAWDERALNIVEAILGSDIELFLDGQSLVKEPVGGHPKLLHQDAAYFEHKYEGPMGMLVYTIDTNLNNGALHVIPGSHKLGVLKHEDTFTHLGLNEEQWTWDMALPVVGGPGDAIFFHVNTIHGSKPNWSDKPRPVFIHRYRRADDYTVISATTAENRAEAEKHVAEAKKQNQLGLMVRGLRRFDAQRA
jgi:phytanoyl-CoA hydroxylase